MKPPRKQVHAELWWRFVPRGNEPAGPWAFSLYIAHPDGRLEGFYNTTIRGRAATPSWDKPAFKRKDILGCDIWEMICELRPEAKKEK